MKSLAVAVFALFLAAFAAPVLAADAPRYDNLAFNVIGEQTITVHMKNGTKDVTADFINVSSGRSKAFILDGVKTDHFYVRLNHVHNLSMHEKHEAHAARTYYYDNATGHYKMHKGIVKYNVPGPNEEIQAQHSENDDLLKIRVSENSGWTVVYNMTSEKFSKVFYGPPKREVQPGFESKGGSKLESKSDSSVLIKYLLSRRG